jgi:hypothetical protein
MSQTAHVEVWVVWQGIHEEQERVLYIPIARPAAIDSPTYEEAISLETKFSKMIPTPRQYWLTLTVQYPIESTSQEIDNQTDHDGDVNRVMRNCQNKMWFLADEHPTDGPLMTLVGFDWLQNTPTDRKVNLKLPKIICDEQIKKLLDILHPVHAVLQLPDPADEEDDAEQQQIQQDYGRTVGRLTGAEAPADFGPNLAVWMMLKKNLQELLHENEAFLSAQPEPVVGSKRTSHPWSSILVDRSRELMKCVDEFIELFTQIRDELFPDSMKARRQIELRFRDCKSFVAQSYVSLLLHTFDVPTKEPAKEDLDRYRHRGTGQYMIITFCPDERTWSLHPKYEEGQRPSHTLPAARDIHNLSARLCVVHAHPSRPRH